MTIELEWRVVTGQRIVHLEEDDRAYSEIRLLKPPAYDNANLDKVIKKAVGSGYEVEGLAIKPLVEPGELWKSTQESTVLTPIICLKKKASQLTDYAIILKVQNLYYGLYRLGEEYRENP